MAGVKFTEPGEKLSDFYQPNILTSKEGADEIFGDLDSDPNGVIQWLSRVI